MRSLQCPNCEYRNTVGAKFCNDCGAQLRLKPCPNCGHQPASASETCSGCGNRRNEETLLEVEPAQDLPVLEDQLLEESYFDVPLLSETWNEATAPLEPERKFPAVTTAIATIVPTPLTVQFDSPVPIKPSRPGRMSVMLGLATVVVLSAVVGVLFGRSDKTVEPSTPAVSQLPAQTSPAITAPSPLPPSSSPLPTPSLSPPAVTPQPALIPSITSATISPTVNPTVNPSASPQTKTECSAALAALSLCSEPSTQPEPKP